jgi:hypothetical protein
MYGYLFFGDQVFFSVQHWLVLKNIIPIRKYELSLSLSLHSVAKLQIMWMIHNA